MFFHLKKSSGAVLQICPSTVSRRSATSLDAGLDVAKKSRLPKKKSVDASAYYRARVRLDMKATVTSKKLFRCPSRSQKCAAQNTHVELCSVKGLTPLDALVTEDKNHFMDFGLYDVKYLAAETDFALFESDLPKRWCIFQSVPLIIGLSRETWIRSRTEEKSRAQ